MAMGGGGAGAMAAPERGARPTIVVPDAAPLVLLALADALPLLHKIGGEVVVVDLVADEVARDEAKPGARALRAWMEAGRAPGSEAPVRVAETEVGRAYARLLRYEPDYRMRNGGETVALEWLAETVAGTDTAVIVLHENGRVPTVVRNQTLDADIDVLTTRAFLELAERRGLVPSADAIWRRVVEAAPTANPRVEFSAQRRRPGPGGDP